MLLEKHFDIQGRRDKGEIMVIVLPSQHTSCLVPQLCSHKDMGAVIPSVSACDKQCSLD